MNTMLAIAGSDSSAGAGIQADLKTATAHGVYGMTAITAMTAQNTMGVYQIQESSSEFLQAQIDACLSDIPADAIKIGMLSSPEQVSVMVDSIRKYEVENVVLDPVMISTSGGRLMSDETRKKLESDLLPLCRIITPNIPEAEVLTGQMIDGRAEMEIAARTIGDKFNCSVLIKGGHSTDGADDVLYDEGHIHWFEGKRIDNPNTHGTGCTLSSAIACNLALGQTLVESVANAKKYLTDCIAAGLNLGSGSGPLQHFYKGEYL